MLKLAAGFLMPILLGFWITILCLPIVAWLRRRGLPGWAAIGIPIVSLALGAIVISYFVIAWIADFANDLPTYADEIAARRADLDAWLISHNISVPSDNLDRQISVESITSFVKVVLPTTLAAISGLGFAFLLIVFSLLEIDAAKRRLRYALGATSPHIAHLRSFVDLVAKAMLLRAVLGASAAIGDGILLLVLGVPNAGLWVVVSFVCSFIPYLGYWIAMVPPVLVALATQGLGTAVVVFFGYWAINGFFDSVVGPRFQGNRLDLSPVVTMLSVLFWGAMFGAIGGMMALPLTLGIKLLLLDAFPESRWLSTVIEADVPESSEPGKTSSR
jgi:predicted PurR-regulated permease PerM